MESSSQVIGECLSFHCVYSQSDLSNPFPKSVKSLHLGSVPFTQRFNYDAKGDLKNEQLLKDPHISGFHQDLQQDHPQASPGSCRPEALGPVSEVQERSLMHRTYANAHLNMSCNVFVSTHLHKHLPDLAV